MFIQSFKKITTHFVLVSFVGQTVLPTALFAMEGEPHYAIKVNTSHGKHTLEVFHKNKEKKLSEKICTLSINDGNHSANITDKTTEQSDYFLDSLKNVSFFALDNGFTWNIPGIATITIDLEGVTHIDGTVQEETAPSFLSMCHLSLFSSQEMIINSLVTKTLKLKSKQTRILGKLTTDSLTVRHDLINEGTNFQELKEFKVMGGVYVNQLLGKGNFLNHGFCSFSEENPLLDIAHFINKKELDAETLTLGANNTVFKNKKTATVKVKTLTEKNDSVVKKDSHFLNKGIVKIQDVQLQRPITNEGLWESRKIATETLMNHSFGILEVSDLCQARDLTNDGEFVTRGTFKLGNKLKNRGKWQHEGDIDLGDGKVTNRGTLIWRNGKLTFKKQLFKNYKDWLFEGISNTSPIITHNEGEITLKDSELTFENLVNSRNMIFISGRYNFTKNLQNKLMSFLENDWVMTDDSTCTSSNRLSFEDEYSPADEIESEKNLTFDLKILPKTIRSEGDLLFTERHAKSRTLKDLAGINAAGSVTFFCPSLRTEQNFEFSNSAHLSLNFLGDFTNEFTLKAPALTVMVRGQMINGLNNNHLGTIASTKGILTVIADRIDNRFGIFSGKGRTHLKSTQGDILVGFPVIGKNPEFKKLYEKLVPCNTSNASPFTARILTERYNTKLDNLFICNEAYVASGDELFLESANQIVVNCGTVFSTLEARLTAKKNIKNSAGKFQYLSGVLIEAENYIQRTKKPKKITSYAYEVEWSEDISSGPAILDAMGDIKFFVTGKVSNLSSTIRNQGKIWINNILLEDRILSSFSNYDSRSVKLQRKLSWKSSPDTIFEGCPSVLQSAKEIIINIGNFVISGDTSSPKIIIESKEKAFFYGQKREESTKGKGNIIQNLTEYAQNQTYGNPIFNLTPQGGVETLFSSGLPFNLNNAIQITEGGSPPPSSPSYFNPLGSLSKEFLNFLAHSGFSDTANRLIPYKEMNGKNFIEYLLDNGRSYSKQLKKHSLTFDDMEKAPKASLCWALQEVAGKYQQQTYIVIPANEMNTTRGVYADEELVIHSGDDHTNIGMNMVGENQVQITSDGNITAEAPVETHVYESGFYQTTKDTEITCRNGPLVYVSQKDFSVKGLDINAKEELTLGSEKTSTHISTQQLTHKHIYAQEEDGGFFGNSSTTTTETTSTTHKPTHVVSQESTVTLLTGQGHPGTVTGSTVESPMEIILQGGDVKSHAAVNSITTNVTTETESLFSSSCNIHYQKSIWFTPSLFKSPKITVNTESAQFNGTDFICEVFEDYTQNGAGFGPTLAWEEYFHQYTSSSPLLSIDMGCKGGREVMQPCRLAIGKIVRELDSGEIKFESVEWSDKTKVEFLCRFSESLYQLKSHHESWQHIDQAISDEAIVVAGLALTMATQGWGSTFFGTSFLGTVGSAGFSSLCGYMSTQFLKHGDPFKAVESAFSEPALKSYMMAMGTAGLTYGVRNGLGIEFTPGSKEFVTHLQENLLKGAIDITLDCTLGGKKLSDKLPETLKKVSIRSIAGYLSNQIADKFGDNEGACLFLETGLGAGVGFAMEGNRDGLLSGGVSVLAAQLMAKVIFSESQSIAQNAHNRLKEEGSEITPESMENALYTEIKQKTDLALLGSSVVTLALGLKPGIEIASNSLENNVTVRQLAYLMPELQSLMIKTSQAMAHAPRLFPVSGTWEIKPKKPEKKKHKAPKKKPVKSTEESLNLNAYWLFGSPTNPYDLLYSLDHNPLNDKFTLKVTSSWPSQPSESNVKKGIRAVGEGLWNTGIHGLSSLAFFTDTLIQTGISVAYKAPLFLMGLAGDLERKARQMKPHLRMYPLGDDWSACEYGMSSQQPSPLMWIAQTEAYLSMRQGVVDLFEAPWTTQVEVGTEVLASAFLGTKGFKPFIPKIVQKRFDRIFTPSIPYTNGMVVPYEKGFSLPFGTVKGFKTMKNNQWSVGSVESASEFGRYWLLANQNRPTAFHAHFLENPYGQVWNKAIYSEVLDLISAPHTKSYFFEAVKKWKKDPNAPFVINVHGSPYSVSPNVNPHRLALSLKNQRILQETGKVELNVVQLARLIVTSKLYKKGQPIVLFSCETGKANVKWRCIADDLAQILKVPVIAADEILYTSVWGHFYVSKMEHPSKVDLKGFFTFRPSHSPLILKPSYEPIVFPHEKKTLPATSPNQKISINLGIVESFKINKKTESIFSRDQSSLKTLYDLKFHGHAAKEWDNLSGSLKQQFTKKLEERLKNPIVPKDQLRDMKNCYKIKLRSSGYRLVYQLFQKDGELKVIGIGKREDMKVYKIAQERLPEKK